MYSLSAIMLSRLQMHIDHALQQYDVVGNNVFGNPRRFHLYQVRRPKYRAKVMKGALQKVVSNAIAGQDGEMSTHAQRANWKKLKNDNAHACHT